MADTIKRTAPGRWMILSYLGGVAYEILPAGQPGAICRMSKDHSPEDINANAAFIALADKHLDADNKCKWERLCAQMEAALRIVQGKLVTVCHVLDDDELADELARAEYHIKELLARVQAERESK